MTIEKIAILVITRGYQSCIKTSQDHLECMAKLPSAGGVECSKAVARQIQDRALGNHHLEARKHVNNVCDFPCEAKRNDVGTLCLYYINGYYFYIILYIYIYIYG